jgi:hypothetical protein
VRIEEQKAEWDTLERLTQAGPVVVTRNGMPLLVVQAATLEWLEALAAETDISGEMSLDEYAGLYGIMLDEGAYRSEFPDDAAFTRPA